MNSAHRLEMRVKSLLIGVVLVTAAGFSSCQVQPLVEPDSLVVAIK